MQAAVLFPGQGSQYAGMADPWLEHPAGRTVIERASEALGWDVAEQSRDEEALKRTDIVQPAVFACDVAAFEVLRADGVVFSAAAGHSLGEYAALVAAGSLVFEDAVRTLDVRAKAMQDASDQNPGAMTALIGMSPQDVHELCEIAGRGDVLQVANENGPRQVVVSGSLAAIERAEDLCRSRGWRSIRLKVAGAFHSPLMEPAVQPVREAISRLEFRTPEFPVVPNASGKATTQPLALRDLLSRHIASPVRWDATMRAMTELGMDWLVEAGPGDVLGKLARRAAAGSTVRSVGSPDEAHAVATELRDGPATPGPKEGA
jgi:[acyl-carrier-protein] S-malonyltransferase